GLRTALAIQQGRILFASIEIRRKDYPHQHPLSVGGGDITSFDFAQREVVVMLLVNMSELSHVATLKVDHEYFRSVIHVCACHDQLLTCLADNGCYVKVALRNLLHNVLLTRAAGVVDFEKLNGTVYRRCEVDFLSIIAPHVIRDGAVPCCGKVAATTE